MISLCSLYTSYSWKTFVYMTHQIPSVIPHCMYACLYLFPVQKKVTCWPLHIVIFSRQFLQIIVIYVYWRKSYVAEGINNNVIYIYAVECISTFYLRIEFKSIRVGMSSNEYKYFVIIIIISLLQHISIHNSSLYNWKLKYI